MSADAGRVVVCGAGVIGACTAYFLAARGVEVHVVEPHRVAGAASGHSGGFLALDWCDGSPLGPLARRSFELHQALADEHGNPWGHRRLDTVAVAAAEPERLRGLDRHPRPDWLDPARTAVHAWLGTPDSTAQVDPRSFTEGMLERAAGATLHHGPLTGLELSPDGSAVRAARTGEQRIEADAVVLAMGPWSVLAAGWLPLPAVYGLKGHSIVVRPREPVGAQALFVEHQLGGHADSPEFFPRPDGTVYVCGLSGSEPLPVDPAAIGTGPEATAKLREMAGVVSPRLAGAELVTANACYRPITVDGLPLMGGIDGIDGAFVATGHNCWGMLNAPASGELMAELVCEGTSRHIDPMPYSPARLPALDRSELEVGAAEG